MCVFYTARNNDTLNNETNSTNEQERMVNNLVSGNITGSILWYIKLMYSNFEAHILVLEWSENRIKWIIWLQLFSLWTEKEWDNDYLFNAAWCTHMLNIGQSIDLVCHRCNITVTPCTLLSIQECFDTSTYVHNKLRLVVVQLALCLPTRNIKNTPITVSLKKTWLLFFLFCVIVSWNCRAQMRTRFITMLELNYLTPWNNCLSRKL